MSAIDDTLDTHALVITLLMVEGIEVQVCTRCGYRYEIDPRPEHKRERHYWCGREVPGPIPCITHDWPAFWRSLPPREMLAAAKAMPKVAGRWANGVRRAANGDPLAWEDSFVDAGGTTTQRHIRLSSNYSESGDVEHYPDRASADAALREAGWVLVDEGTEDRP